MADSGNYHDWKATNVVAQRQEGYYLVYVKPPRGDITHSQFRALANIARRYTGGRASARPRNRTWPFVGCRVVACTKYGRP